MRRAVFAALALLVLLAAIAIAKVEHDRRQCPPGRWAHPVDRLKGGSHTYKFACVG